MHALNSRLDSGFAPFGAPRNDRGERMSRTLQILLSCRHASSAPRTECADRQISLSVFRAWPGFFHASLREAERRNGAGLTGAPLRRRPARPCEGRRAFRRSTVAIYCEATVRDSIGPAGFSPTMLQGAFAPAFTRPRPATEGGPLIGDGRWHRTLGRGYGPRLQAPHPAPPTKRP